jgi:hypothetical protein
MLARAISKFLILTLLANLESEDSPKEIRGLMISTASRIPDPSSSHEMNKFLANSICFLLFDNFLMNYLFFIQFSPSLPVRYMFGLFVPAP